MAKTIKNNKKNTTKVILEIDRKYVADAKTKALQHEQEKMKRLISVYSLWKC